MVARVVPNNVWSRTYPLSMGRSQYGQFFVIGAGPFVIETSTEQSCSLEDVCKRRARVRKLACADVSLGCPDSVSCGSSS